MSEGGVVGDVVIMGGCEGVIVGEFGSVMVDGVMVGGCDGMTVGTTGVSVVLLEREG